MNKQVKISNKKTEMLSVVALKMVTSKQKRAFCFSLDLGELSSVPSPSLKVLILY